MCYSGRCRWENHNGDCSFPIVARKINFNYYKTMCSSGIDNIELYNEIKLEIKIIKITKERKEKILSLKNKLLTQNI